jgi:hypothetical protein
MMQTDQSKDEYGIPATPAGLPHIKPEDEFYFKKLA